MNDISFSEAKNEKCVRFGTTINPDNRNSFSESINEKSVRFGTSKNPNVKDDVRKH